MKRLTLSALLCFASFFAFYANGQEKQKPVIMNQPLWGPAGYNVAAYYYLPDIETYYDIPAKKFIYQEKSEWVFSNELPAKFQSYDLYRGHKVVINRPHPYFNIAAHRVRHARFRGQANTQLTIRDSTNPKYDIVKAQYKSPQNQGQAN
ncbi:MAG: hypothetical protein H7Y07_09090 [Pyrinomonadaceae bacterium]|nr:hypothetical protein [Sphingobacteriaceae bacterium]